VEDVRPRSMATKIWECGCGKYGQARQCKEDAVDHRKWTKFIK